jgi:choline dehydrogenase-like flavoprotein
VTEHYDAIVVGSGAGDGKAHELDNLYVVDTSIFPSIGAVNPALTAIANAIRVGEHLLSQMS